MGSLLFKNQIMTKPKFKSLNIRGTVYKTTLTKKFENRKFWKNPNEKEVLSFIPGTVLKVSVEEGKNVKEGELLYIFEAMKMENKVLAPLSGKIKKININVGDKFPKGIVLFEYE